MRLIDFDQVTLSSLNRSSVALRNHVGQSKVQVLKDILKKINPSIDLDLRQVFLSKDNQAKLLEGTNRLKRED